MKAVQDFAGHTTFDLSEGKVHKVTDAAGATRFVVMFPETWEALGPKRAVETVSGPLALTQYRVLTWSEHKLVLE